MDSPSIFHRVTYILGGEREQWGGVELVDIVHGLTIYIS